MKSLLLSAGVVVLLCGAAAGQSRPDGWQMTGCDPDQFTAVLNSDGNVAYWTNPTCPASAGGGTVRAAIQSPAQGGGAPPTQTETSIELPDGPIDPDQIERCTGDCGIF